MHNIQPYIWPAIPRWDWLWYVCLSVYYKKFCTQILPSRLFKKIFLSPMWYELCHWLKLIWRFDIWLVLFFCYTPSDPSPPPPHTQKKLQKIVFSFLILLGGNSQNFLCKFVIFFVTFRCFYKANIHRKTVIYVFTVAKVNFYWYLLHKLLIVIKISRY